MHYKYAEIMKQNTKDWIRHISAMSLIVASIAMGFLAFVMTQDIGAGPLTYIGESLSAALALLGLSMYLVDRVGSLEEKVNQKLGELRKEGNDHEKD